MKLGLHLPDFTWPGGPPTLGQDLGRVAAAAEDAGFARLSVMDHVWQIGNIGPPEHEMLEAYTTLGYLAASTSRIEAATPAHQSSGRCSAQPNCGTICSCSRAAMCKIAPVSSTSAARTLPVPTSMESVRSRPKGSLLAANVSA